MAVLKLICYDLISFIKNKLNILLILIVGIAVSSFALCFYYCTAITEAENTYRFDTAPREIKAIFSQNISPESLAQFIESKKQDAQEINLLDNNALMRCMFNFRQSSESTEAPNSLGIVGRYTANKPNLRSGRWFDENDTSVNNIVISHGIIVPESENVLSIDGTKYNVIGSIGDTYYPNCVFMDINSFISSGKSTSAVIITLNQTPDTLQIAAMESELRQLDESLEFFAPSERANNIDILTSFLRLLTVPILIIIFSFVSIFSLYRFWLVQCRKTHAIYKICGAKNSTFTLYLMLEIVIITAVGFIIGTGAFYLVFALSNPTEILRGPKLLELILLYAAALIISMFASLPSIIRAAKLSPVEMKEGQK